MKENQSPKLKIDSGSNRKHKREAKSTMQFVECTCEEKILIIPDVVAMSRAVKHHLREHKDADEQFLIGQILETASIQAQLQ
jgi:hypothetical protein